MKKSIVISAVIGAVLAFASCGTTKVESSGIKGETATVAKTYKQVVDYQGAVLGREVPAWVLKVLDGDYTSQALSSVMPDLKGKKIFVTIGRGDNLEFVRTWTDQVSVETEVASTMQRVAAKTASTTMSGASKGEGKTMDPTVLERALDQATACVTLVTLNGLEKTASYWVEVAEYENKKMETKTNEYFEYYAVWSMDEKLYEAQIKSAVKTIDENTSEGKLLKDNLAKRLFDVTVASNDNNVNEIADSYIVEF